MALVIESTSTQSYIAPTGNDVDINKPAGLIAGDLMVACVTHHADVDNVNIVFTTPTGWTELYNKRIGLTSGDGMAQAVFYKIADSSDVSASEFTFSVISAQDYMGGCILRVSGLRTDTVLGGSDADEYTDTDNPVYSVSLSPAQDNILYIATFQSGSVTYTTTDVTLNGTNPTWTSQFNTAVTVDAPSRFEVFTAIDTSPESSITSLTPVETGSTSSTDSSASLSFFLGSNDASGTLEFIVETDTAFDVSGTAGVHGNIDFIEGNGEVFDVSVDVDQPNRWINDTKPSNMWTNQDK